MFELLALQIYASSGLLALMVFGAVVYFIFKFFNGDYSSTTETTDNGQGSNNSTPSSNTTSSSNTINNKAPAERNYEGYIEHGDTILLKSLTKKNKKNRPNTYDCYGERWDDNTGHFQQLFTYERPLTFFEPKHIETGSIDIEEYDKQSKFVSSQFFDYVFDKPNTLNDYKIEKYLPIKVDSSVKQDKGWMVTLAMILADFRHNTTFRPAYDLIVSNKVYLYGKYKTEMACAAYETLKDSYISDIKNDSDELSANIINNLYFYFEHSNEDYFDFLKRNNFNYKHIDSMKKINPEISKLFNSDVDLILKHWNDSNIQKDDIYLCTMDHAVSSNIDFVIRNYIIVREVPLTH
jgi:hypothetical protein|nr:MAG TPA: hypothetical protein [Caudoviricetes sp.]